jgi:hypothetical protein
MAFLTLRVVVKEKVREYQMTPLFYHFKAQRVKSIIWEKGERGHKLSCIK